VENNELLELVHLITPPSLEGIIDTSTKFKAHIPTALIDTGQGQIGVVRKDILDYILREQEKYFNTFHQEEVKIYTNVIKEQKKIIKQLEKGFREALDILNKEREAYQEAFEENQLYKEEYGNYLSPVQIIKELYNNKKKGEGDLLTYVTDFKSINYKTHQKGIMRWMSLFEEWGILVNTGRYDNYALMSQHQAVLLYKEKKRNKEI
jgi:hypothetical protein